MAARAFWLNSKLVSSAVTAELRNPYDGRVFAEVCQAEGEHAEAALAGMKEAFGTLRRWSSYQRYAVCRAVFEGLNRRQEEFAHIIALEAGKPIQTARAEVTRALLTFRLAAEEATRIGGEQLPVDVAAHSQQYHAVVERFPVGPCTFITPFNFPLNLVAHKVGPALAAGCPFVVKPSERTPLTALLLGELLAESGLPVGAWHVLPCDRGVAEKLVTDGRVKHVSFTGSPGVGWKIKALANEKGVTLELGNASAVVVEPDADLAEAVPRMVAGAYGYAGQSCISVQRIFLHERIAEKVTAMLVEGIGKLVVGDPMDEKTDVGPMIDEAGAARVEEWIKGAVAGGATLLAGGGRRGRMVEPSLLAEVPARSPLVCEEAFGPVAVIERYWDFGDVLRRVNATPFGLQAGLFTRDLFKARMAFEMLDVGGVVINDVPTVRIDNMPYGGVKNSGSGREGVKYAIEQFTERKVLVTRWR